MKEQFIPYKLALKLKELGFGRHFNKEPDGTSLKLDNINLFIK